MNIKQFLKKINFAQFKIKREGLEYYLVKNFKKYLGPFEKIDADDFLNKKHSYVICHKDLKPDKNSKSSTSNVYYLTIDKSYIFKYNKIKDKFIKVFEIDSNERIKDFYYFNNKSYIITINLGTSINNFSIYARSIVGYNIYLLESNKIKPLLLNLDKKPLKELLLNNSNDFYLLTESMYSKSKYYLIDINNNILEKFDNLEELNEKLYYCKELKSWPILDINSSNKEIINLRKKYLKKAIKENNKIIFKILFDLYKKDQKKFLSIEGFNEFLETDYFKNMIIKNISFKKNQKKYSKTI